MLREEAFLEGEVLELVLPLRLLGLRLERLDERRPVVHRVQMQPQRERLRKGQLLEQAVGHVLGAKVAPPRKLVGDGDVAQHGEPDVVDAVRIADQLQVGLDERHHDGTDVLADGELDLIEDGAVAAMGCHVQVVRAVTKQLVQHVVRTERRRRLDHVARSLILVAHAKVLLVLIGAALAALALFGLLRLRVCATGNLLDHLVRVLTRVERKHLLPDGNDGGGGDLVIVHDLRAVGGRRDVLRIDGEQPLVDGVVDA